MENTEFTYVLSANDFLISLFENSLEAFLKHPSFDFMVFKFKENDKDEILEETREWKTSVQIDKLTYSSLYGNLCKKFRKELEGQNKCSLTSQSEEE